MPAKKNPPPRWLDYLPIDEIESALDNPKNHDEALIDELIDEHGFMEPAVLDERTGRLVSGHGRRDKLRNDHEMGQEPPEGIIVLADGRWAMPVTRGWSSRDDDHAHAAGLGINQATIAGGFDDRALASTLTKIAESPTGLVGTGFDDSALGDLLDKLAKLDEPAKDSPFDDFGNNGPEVIPLVSFRFGDYSGKVNRPLYERFVERFEAEREGGDAAMLDDVLAGWLGLEDSGAPDAQVSP